MDTLKIDPKKLIYSQWNVNTVSPENMEKLKQSIKRNGIIRPIIVRQVKGQFEVIAGEHTTRVAIELGIKEIDIYNLGEISDAKAKEISVIDNQHYGVEDAYGLASLLQEIEGNPADFLPFSDSEMESLFKSVKIDLSALDLPDDLDFDSEPEAVIARAPVDHQVMRLKIPIKDAEFVTRVIESIIKRQGFKQTDSMAAAGDAIVWLCNKPIED